MGGIKGATSPSRQFPRMKFSPAPPPRIFRIKLPMSIISFFLAARMSRHVCEVDSRHVPVKNDGVKSGGARFSIFDITLLFLTARKNVTIFTLWGFSLNDKNQPI